MSTPESRFNPFPGLRPFERDEDHLFFGREKEIDEVVRRLRLTRFLSVIGTSGSGKSSLIRSGLIPALYSGAMVKAGSSWRMAVMRPGEDPTGNLAVALSAPDVLGTDPATAGTTDVLVEATLRRSSRGLADAVRLARLPPHDNVLVVVDQFEELFRFRQNRRIDNSRDEAVAFVKLLLEATQQAALPIYVVITMRSDFVGDCMTFPGLAEAVNDGQYLVPRMQRDALRLAITGPVAVGGGTIAPRLVLRLLNDIGDDIDQLPLLQHALMRTWNRWVDRAKPGEPLDVGDYEDVGTLRQALSLHAEETYQQTGSHRARQIAERMFKALTDTFSDARGVRRPTAVAELALICEANEAEIIEIADAFRAPGRSFLMPPSAVALKSASILDLSHESLMRCWDRLVEWCEEERSAAAFYARLSQAAAWEAQAAGGLWDAPELDLALQWKEQTQPTDAWARRYEGSLAEAISFLDRSAGERKRRRAEREQARRAKLRKARLVAAVFAVLFVAAGGLAYFAWMQRDRAEKNLDIARQAVEESLSSARVDPALAGADTAQMVAFRSELLEKAEGFYRRFLELNPPSEGLRKENADAHMRLGDIHRMRGNTDRAVTEYEEAIRLFKDLDAERPLDAYKSAIADAENWLGETLRPIPGRAEEAASAYDRALSIQQQLAASGDPAARLALARTHNNRGILRWRPDSPGDARNAAAEADFREAIGILESVARSAGAPNRHELARAYNNLASLLDNAERLAEARPLYEQAIAIDEQLFKESPNNREYPLELAGFRTNAAELYRRLEQFDIAQQHNARARELFEMLARPPSTMGIAVADAHTVLGTILEGEKADPMPAYEEALHRLQEVTRDPGAVRLEDFHLRFSELLLSLAARARDSRDEAARALLRRGLEQYLTVSSGASGSGATNATAFIRSTLTELLQNLEEGERQMILARHPDLAGRTGR